MSRLSEQQMELARKRASEFQEKLVEKARGRVPHGADEGVFFAALFHLAGETIELDVDGFCEKADEVFEKIEAHGQEPTLDTDWLGEIVGDRDTFNFSTENLVSELVSAPRRKRRKKQLSYEERERIRQEIKDAIIDDKGEGQSFEQAIAVAHGEDVQGWIEDINRALRKEGGQADFWILWERTKLQPVELLLGLLLGQQYWNVRQTEFYGTVNIEAIV